MSMTNPQPSEEDCSTKSGKAKKLLVFAKEREKEFSNDYVYFTLMSYSGVSVELTPKF